MASEQQRILVSTLGENREPFWSEIEELYSTLREFGGKLSTAAGKALLIGSADEEFRARMERLDVQVTVVDPIDERTPHSNKIRMLEHAEGYDYLVGLDTDIVVAADFSDYVTGTAIAAKPVDADPLAPDTWLSVYEYFGLEPPQARFLTSFDMRETVPYFNSGVILVPGKHVAPLHDVWLRFIPRIFEASVAISGLREHLFYCDQIAFALSLAAGRFPLRPLPIEMNFPTHAPLHPSLRPGTLDPLLLHHHHKRTATGELELTGYSGAAAALGRINALRRRRASSDPAV